MTRLIITACMMAIVAGLLCTGVEAAMPIVKLAERTVVVAQLLVDSTSAPDPTYVQTPGPPGGTGGVIPPGGRLPHPNGAKPTPEGTNPGPLPPGSNGGPPPKEKDEMPKNLNPQDDPNIRKGYEKHQREHGK